MKNNSGSNMLKKYVYKFKKIPMHIKVSALYVICSIIQKGISFIIVPLYTRLVPTEQYGYYSLYQSWESILCVFATFNMWNYLFSKGMIKYKERKDEFISSLIGLGIVLTSVVCVILYIFREQIEKISGLAFPMLLIMCVSLLFKPSYEYWIARQRYEYKIKKYIAFSLLISIMTPMLSIVLILYDKSKGSNNLGLMMILGKIGIPIIVYLFIFVFLLKKSMHLYDLNIWKYAFSFSLPLVPHFLSIIILQQSDRIMIGSICGNQQVAIYSVAYSVSTVMLLFNSAFIDTMIPWLYKKMNSNDYADIDKISNYSLLLISLVNMIISLFSPEIIHIMGPNEYQLAKYVIPPVTSSNILIFLFNLFANIEYYYEETKFVMVSSCISAAINIILNSIFIPKYGFLAAAFTTLVSYIVYASMHYIFMRIVLKKHNVIERVYDDRKLCIISIFAILFINIVPLVFEFLLLRILVLLISCFFILVLVINYINLRREKELTI